tara:strand:- start:86 stop:904 length:819 start_codon:yes stop_codon:yes gene_type:complete
MKILIREEQFIKLLNEDISGLVNRDYITFNDIWYGYEKFKHGDMQSQPNSPLLVIQEKLYKKFPEYAEEINFTPDNDFGDKTSKMIGKLFDTEFKDLTSVKIGPNVLSKLGFEKPPTLSLPTKILAMTLSMEKYSNDIKEIQAIANIIANRSSAGRGTLLNVVLKNKQFSGWNEYQPVKVDDSSINNIMREKRYMNRPSWDTAVKYAKLLLNGSNFEDNTNGATHYYNPDKVNPSWGKNSKYWISHGPDGLDHKFGRDTKSNWSKEFKGRKV